MYEHLEKDRQKDQRNSSRATTWLAVSSIWERNEKRIKMPGASPWKGICTIAGNVLPVGMDGDDVRRGGPKAANPATIGRLAKGRWAVKDLVGCPCTGKNLVRFVHPAILAVLAREPLHGYLILERLAKGALFRDQPPDPAGVYRILKNMEQEGLLTCTWDLQSSGPARRQYTVTQRGLACLGQWLKTLEIYQQSLDVLIGDIQQSLKV